MIITIAAGKGGTGKTTTAAEIVVYLASKGRTVRALDMDRQGQLTKRLGLDLDAAPAAVAADVLNGEATAAEAAIDSPLAPGIQVIAGTHDVDRIRVEGRTPAGTQRLIASMAQRIRDAAEGVDDVVIDTRPVLEGVTQACLMAADHVVTACLCTGEAYEQVDELIEFLDSRLERQLDSIALLAKGARRTIDREVEEVLTETYPALMAPTVRESVTVKDAYVARMPVTVFRPRHAVSDDFRAACAHITGL